MLSTRGLSRLAIIFGLIGFPADTCADAAKQGALLDGAEIASMVATAGNVSAFSLMRTGDSAERVSALPLNGDKQVIYSLPVEAREGDIIVAFGEFEATRDTREKFNVLVTAQIILANDPGDTIPVDGGEVTEENGRNISRNLHHDVHVKAGAVRVSSPGVYHVSMVSRAASTSGTYDVRIERDYGHLAVIVLSGNRATN